MRQSLIDHLLNFNFDNLPLPRAEQRAWAGYAVDGLVEWLREPEQDTRLYYTLSRLADSLEAK